MLAKRAAIYLPAIALALVVLGSCDSQTEPASKPTFQIGVVAPFSGQEGAAVYGENIKNGVDLAIAEINARGGVRGHLLSAKYEDDQLKAPVAVAAVQKLATVDRVPVIIGPVASSSTIAAAAVANSIPVVLVSPASTSHEISGLSRYVFRTIAPDTYEGTAMANYAWKRGLRRVGIVYVDNAGTKGPAEVFRKAFEAAGGKVVAFEVVPQGSVDVRTQITTTLLAAPEAIYLLGYALELGSMIKQTREQDAKIPILSFQVMEEPKVREIAGNAAEGIVFTTPTIYRELATGNQSGFIEAYAKKYGKDPGIFAANAYDAVGVIAKAIEAKGFEVEQIREGLSMIRGYVGATGKFDIDEKGDSNQQPRFMTVRDGRLVPVVE